MAGNIQVHHGLVYKATCNNSISKYDPPRRNLHISFAGLSPESSVHDDSGTTNDLTPCQIRREYYNFLDNKLTQNELDYKRQLVLAKKHDCDILERILSSPPQNNCAELPEELLNQDELPWEPLSYCSNAILYEHDEPEVEVEIETKYEMQSETEIPILYELDEPEFEVEIETEPEMQSETEIPILYELDEPEFEVEIETEPEMQSETEIPILFYLDEPEFEVEIETENEMQVEVEIPIFYDLEEPIFEVEIETENEAEIQVEPQVERELEPELRKSWWSPDKPIPDPRASLNLPKPRSIVKPLPQQKQPRNQRAKTESQAPRVKFEAEPMRGLGPYKRHMRRHKGPAYFNKLRRKFKVLFGDEDDEEDLYPYFGSRELSLRE